MDLAKQLKANGKIQRKTFELLFERFNRTFSDCEVVDLNELYRASEPSNISSQQKTTYKGSSRASKNKRKRRQPSKLVVATTKKFPKYRTRSVSKRKRICSTSNKGTATRHVRKLKIARKSNRHLNLKKISPSPLLNVSGNSVFCEPPTVINLDFASFRGGDDDNDVDLNQEIASNQSEFCNPPTIIEANHINCRSAFCTPPTVIKEKLDRYFIRNKKKQSDIWHSRFSRYYAPINQDELTKQRKITKALTRWHKYFAHMFPS